MGDGVSACGKVPHEVTLTRDFLLGGHEITNAEFLEMLQWAFDQGLVTATRDMVLDNMDGCRRELVGLGSKFSEIGFDGEGEFFLRESPCEWARKAYPEGYDPARHPAKEVTWYGAAAYCDWLSLREGLDRAYDHDTWLCNGGDPYGAKGYRLPTDAEWEFIARGGDDRRYPWGDDPVDGTLCNVGGDAPAVGWSTPVGSYPEAPAGSGFYDLAGNLGEWCNDWRECNLAADPVTNPTGPEEGRQRVLRGGNWRHSPAYVQTSLRHAGHPFSSYSYMGFRVARTHHQP